MKIDIFENNIVGTGQGHMSSRSIVDLEITKDRISGLDTKNSRGSMILLVVPIVFSHLISQGKTKAINVFTRLGHCQ